MKAAVSHLLGEIAHDIFTGDDANEHPTVIGDGDKVLIECFDDQIFYFGIGCHRQIIHAAGERCRE